MSFSSTKWSIGWKTSVHEGRIYRLKLFCDKDYPDKPPSVRFHSRINLTCVNHETGVVEAKKFDMLANWQRDYTMEDRHTGPAEGGDGGATQPKARPASRRHLLRVDLQVTRFLL
ncbi:hypothetical protein C4D60_Mb09t26050 [Musa balbisiana]|uniref:UBC core domain-containing protein n=1 Tax=Musa balbisiana TaxID=52838 RepID=A0A4S8IJX8_MUSBA|nr:hypothetical protein C4D60_Mb09t26050 [Musa balbisiana]